MIKNFLGRLFDYNNYNEIEKQNIQYDLMHFDNTIPISKEAINYSKSATVRNNHYKNENSCYEDNLVSFNIKKNIDQACVSNVSDNLTISFNKNNLEKNEITRTE